MRNILRVGPRLFRLLVGGESPSGSMVAKPIADTWPQWVGDRYVDKDERIVGQVVSTIGEWAAYSGTFSAEYISRNAAVSAVESAYKRHRGVTK